MAEQLKVPQEATRAERYRWLQKQLPALLDPPAGRVANAANMVAALMEAFHFHWIGFYFVSRPEGTEELIVGPYQGPVACSRIGFGKGVCGTAWQQQRTINVPDVEKFPGHIACSPFSRSEIVVPVVKNGQVIGVLDIDSSMPADFSEIDQRELEQLIQLLLPCL